MGCTFELRFFSYEILIIDSQERRRLKIDMMIAITFLDPVLSKNCFIYYLLFYFNLFFQSRVDLGQSFIFL